MHIGSGEGSQVYGWGLYGSTVRGVAEGYADITNIAVKQALRRAKGDSQKAIADLEQRLTKAQSPNAKEWERLSSAQISLVKQAIDSLKTGKQNNHVYEQTWFTDRAPGDESHLLKWYEPVSEQQLGTLKNAGIETVGNESLADGTFTLVKKDSDGNSIGLGIFRREDFTGGKLYQTLSRELGSPQAASEFLARAGIDGVKYPVDSYGAKTVKNGDEVGWNYVSFRIQLVE